MDPIEQWLQAVAAADEAETVKVVQDDLVDSIPNQEEYEYDE